MKMEEAPNTSLRLRHLCNFILSSTPIYCEILHVKRANFSTARIKANHNWFLAVCVLRSMSTVRL